MSWAWLGVVPFFLFALMFLIAPMALLIVGGFQDGQGHFTFRNLLDLFQPSIVSAYLISIKVSAASAIGGALSASCSPMWRSRAACPPGSGRRS